MSATNHRKGAESMTDTATQTDRCAGSMRYVTPTSCVSRATYLVDGTPTCGLHLSAFVRQRLEDGVTSVTVTRGGAA